MIEFLHELWRYARARKKYVLLPILLILLLMGFLIISVQGTAIAPFIYAVF